jgi:hypothetical protein
MPRHKVRMKKRGRGTSQGKTEKAIYGCHERAFESSWWYIRGGRI